MMRVTVIALLLTQAPPPRAVVWTTDGTTATAKSGATVLAVVSGSAAAGSPAADDQVVVSTSTTTAAWTTISDCDGATKALNYRAATNSFACNTFSAGSGYATIQEEGSDLTQRDTLNFVGAISCVDDTTRTTCTVSGGSGASPLILSFGGF